MSIATPPQRNPRTRRYPVTLMGVARRMYGNGDSWTVGEIRNYLAEHHGADGISENTVRGWVIPAFADEQRRLNRRTQARRKGSRDHRARMAREEILCWAALVRRELTGALMAALAAQRFVDDLTDEQAEDRMLTLRDIGLSFTSISSVMKLYHGLDITPHQVRYRLQTRRGVAKMEGKARAMREVWAEQKAAA